MSATKPNRPRPGRPAQRKPGRSRSATPGVRPPEVDLAVLGGVLVRAWDLRRRAA